MNNPKNKNFLPMLIHLLRFMPKASEFLRNYATDQANRMDEAGNEIFTTLGAILKYEGQQSVVPDSLLANLHVEKVHLIDFLDKYLFKPESNSDPDLEEFREMFGFGIKSHVECTVCKQVIFRKLIFTHSICTL